MKPRITALVALLLCLSFSCTQSAKDHKAITTAEAPSENLESDIKDINAGYSSTLTDSTVQEEKQTPPAPPGNEKKKQPSQTTPLPQPDWDKKIIKTAFLNFEVKDYKSYYGSFREKVRNLGGYIAQEEQTQSDYKVENTLVIKVPVDQFDNALAQFTTGTEKINERKITSEDVTAEYVDTRSRIEAKKQVRQRYMDLLNQAKNMEEILDVQSEINSIQEDIESASGRIEYLGHASAYSTINLTYYQVLNSSAKDDGEKDPVFGTRLADAFKTGWGWIVELFVGLISIWPLLLLGFGIYVIYRRNKTVRTKQA